MSKIIKLNGEEVLIGTDDGKIRKVRIYDVQFAPIEGDEVDIFESDGQVLVTKKASSDNNTSVVQSNNNYIEQLNNNSIQPKKTDVSVIFLYAAMILSIVACFLPIFSISIFGFTYSINYVYNDGQVADGIFIIAIQVLALILLLCDKRKVVCVLEYMAFIILAITIYNVAKRLSSSSSLSFFSLFDVGFYLLLLFLLASVILSTIHARKK